MTRPKTDPKMETDRKREEAIDKELASPRPPLPKLTRHRVSNAVGSLVTGARGRRRVMLLHRPAWRDLHSVDDLWISALAKAPRLVRGHNSDEPRGLRINAQGPHVLRRAV
jgi:hypothetical protein